VDERPLLLGPDARGTLPVAEHGRDPTRREVPGGSTLRHREHAGRYPQSVVIAGSTATDGESPAAS
jgi:hypothetical protein